jgi:hypothetical protein
LADRGLIPVYRLRGTRILRVNAAAADSLWDREPSAGGERARPAPPGY